MSFRVIFVTVGTTEFDSLLQSLDSSSFFQYLISVKCKKLIIQHGRGCYEFNILPELCHRNDIVLETFRFSDSLDKFMKEAALIICHAGDIHDDIFITYVLKVPDQLLRLSHCKKM
jgi:beta-1,4-N-acetylglucosaminyltransferase